jgi:hypothetical protein
MNDSRVMNKGNRDRTFAWLSFGLLILCLGLQYFSPASELSRLTTFLLEGLKISASLSFAWFTQKLLSREEYINNLRERAVSAYRRIKDLKGPSPSSGMKSAI